MTPTSKFLKVSLSSSVKTWFVFLSLGQLNWREKLPHAVSHRCCILLDVSLWAISFCTQKNPSQSCKCSASGYITQSDGRESNKKQTNHPQTIFWCRRMLQKHVILVITDSKSLDALGRLIRLDFAANVHFFLQLRMLAVVLFFHFHAQTHSLRHV